MKVIVVDTSAVVRLFVPDGPLPEGLEDAVDLAWRGEVLLAIPELALVEAAQVLWKKQRSGYLTASEADEIMTHILELPFEIYGHRELVAPAMQMARTHCITVYDALFLALAAARMAELITADVDLGAAFERQGTLLR